MLVWVPTEQVAEAVAGLAGVQTEIVNLDQAAADGDTSLPASAAKVQFCVLPFFPQEPALAAWPRCRNCGWSRRRSPGSTASGPGCPPG